MGRIFDLSLKNKGYDRINWVKSYMPVLSKIAKRFETEKPFVGLKIAMSIHLEAKTAYLAMVLKAGGAQVAATGCNPLTTNDDIAAALTDAGFEINAVCGATMEEYESDLLATLSCCPDLIIDDGGDFVNLLHSPKGKAFAANLKGGCEETTTGVLRLQARSADGKLDFPMININDADLKHLFDNRYGTGQSTMDGLMQATNVIIAGKRVVIAGYGWCGRGFAARAKGMGARVIITEIDPVRAIEAKFDGFDVMTMDEAAPLGDIFVTMTGCRDVITARHFARMKDGAILANAGHFDVEISKNDLSEMAAGVVRRKEHIQGFVLPDGRILNLLSEGRLVNLAAGQGHPAEIMDLSFSLQALSLEHLATSKKLLPGVYSVPEEIDQAVARMKLNAMGNHIDELTEAQKKYLSSYSGEND